MFSLTSTSLSWHTNTKPWLFSRMKQPLHLQVQLYPANHWTLKQTEKKKTHDLCRTKLESFSNKKDLQKMTSISLFYTSVSLFLSHIQGEGESGKIWENGIETCEMSCMKRDASPGSMHDAGCLGLVHWDDPEGLYYTQRDGMGREEGGGFRMGNTCIIFF